MAYEQRMFVFLRWLIPAIFCCAYHASAEPLRLLILLSSDQSYYQLTADAMLGNIDPAIPVTSQQHPYTAFPTIEQSDYDLIVAIGTQATKSALGNCVTKPVLSIFIPESTFASLAANRHSCSEAPPVSAVYLDQPLSRFLDLAQQLKPHAKTLGVVLGPASEDRLPTIKALARQRGLALKYAIISSRDNPIAMLRPLVAQSDVVLPLPDRGPINRAVAKWILNLSFQNKTPVVGFSRAYTEAGAVASVFSSPENVGRQAGLLISNWRTKGDSHIWSPQFPDDFTLHTNDIVGRSLDIPLEASEELKLRIKQREKPDEAIR